jgi:tRNA threonylcarbamoyladenosine biosynthesis protein TsaB
MLLAIDTATRYAGVALYDGHRVLAEETWRSANYHTVELMPAVVRMLDRQGVDVAALKAIGISLGPGSFTGLRIGMGVAKGLALTRQIPLLGVSTLRATAYPHFHWRRGAVCAVVEAGRTRLCVQFFRRRRGRWRPAEGPRLTTPEGLCDLAEVTTLFCGEIDATLSSLLQERLEERAVLVSPAASLRRAGYLAELAWNRFRRGEADDLNALSPIYLQQPASAGGDGDPAPAVRPTRAPLRRDERAAVRLPVPKFWQAVAALLAQKRVYLAPKGTTPDFSPPEQGELIGWYDRTKPRLLLLTKTCLARVKEYWQAREQRFKMGARSLRRELWHQGYLVERGDGRHFEKKCYIDRQIGRRRVLVIDVEQVEKKTGIVLAEHWED